MSDCLFCKIAAGEIPSNKVYEDEICYAFYDIAPQAPTHFLVIPKAHIGSVSEVSGENSAVVAHIFEVIAQLARQLGLDEVHAQLLPADKVDRVEDLLRQTSPKGALAFVGDGINDAPVLSRADIGIAMGALGSDAAIEAADVVLMDDKPSKIALAIRIARKTRSIVRQNIVFALGVKFLVLGLGAFGLANMWEAVFADVGVSVIAILNSMRALHSPSVPS